MTKKMILILVVFSFGIFVGKNFAPKNNTTTVNAPDEKVQQIQQLLSAQDPDYSKIFLLLLAHLNLSHNISADEIKFVLENTNQEIDDTNKNFNDINIESNNEQQVKQDPKILTQTNTVDSTSNEQHVESTSLEQASITGQEKINNFQDTVNVNSNIKNLYKNAYALVEPINFPTGDYSFRFSSKRFTNSKNANLLNINHNLIHNGKFFNGEINIILSNDRREISNVKGSGPNSSVLMAEYKKSKKLLIEISDYIFVFNIQKKNSKQTVILDQGLVYFKNNFEEVLKFTPLGKFHLIR